MRTLPLAFRRVRLFVRLFSKRPPAAQAHADAEEHQRAWSEQSRAAERFHAIVLESRAQPSGDQDGARPSG